jgi:serine/threonine-protein kinase
MTAFGKYKLLDPMGTGAAGTTYRALDTFLNREVVVKVLDPALTGNSELRDQVGRGLGRAAELNHPHIARIRDLGEVDGAVYIASDLLNGVDLRWHMERRILPMVDKIDLIAQVCQGLAYAHSMGMPHGNLKPGNIYVTEKQASILDFGIGKCLASIVEAGGRAIALLPNYFAPEQVLGKPFKARSDVFSVGVILYELLAKYPFPADANLIPREIVHTRPEPLRTLDPQIPEDLEKLVVRALEKDPEERLESMEEFAAGLFLVAQRMGGGVASPLISPAPLAEPSEPLLPAAFSPMYPAQAPPRPAAPAVVAAPVVPTPVPEPAVNPAPAEPVTVAAVEPTATEPKSPQPAKRPAPGKPARKRSRWLPYAVAAVMTISIVLVFLSKQNIDASPGSTQSSTIAAAPAAQQPQSAPAVEQPAATPAAQDPAHAAPAAAPAVEAPPATPAAAPKSSEDQTLNQVKSLWASGKYALALEKVNDLLTAHPESMEGRIWKKKIRAAQEAEAAMK